MVQISYRDDLFQLIIYFRTRHSRRLSLRETVQANCDHSDEHEGNVANMMTCAASMYKCTEYANHHGHCDPIIRL